MDPQTEERLLERDALEYFLALKKVYADQRQPWESKWKQALAAVYMTDSLDKIYNGRAQIQNPTMQVKVTGIVSRIMKILFNVSPIARIEDKKVDKTKKEIVDLWNKYIFEDQLDRIGFKDEFRTNQYIKATLGTCVAKICQEYETKEISYDDINSEDVTVKDDTYYKPVLLTEFYSDITKSNINESQACIHSTVVTMDSLKAHEKRTVTKTYELIDQTSQNVVGTQDEVSEEGIYKNLELLEVDGGSDSTSPQLDEYIQLLGLNKSQTVTFLKTLKDTKKTGFVQVDECYGRYIIDGKSQEAVCTIANGRVVIRGPEPTTFKHRRYVRPFVVGVYKPIPFCLYGLSNVISGMNLLQELNAARAQASDARTYSVFPMMYQDVTKVTNWDGQWRPMGIIKGQGQKGIDYIANPFLGNVSINDAEIIQRDLDQLWSLSPVQEGTSDNRLVPQTASATMAIISQNDMPLNEVIDITIENELKPFIEMLYERNLTFKTMTDLLEVWDRKQIESFLQKTGADEANIQDKGMEMMKVDHNIKVLGNLELSNEVAHQAGYSAFLQLAANIPPLAKRVDWKTAGEKLLRAYGIKDDAEGLLFEDDLIAKVDQENQQGLQQQAEAQAQAKEAERVKNLEDYKSTKEIDTESEIVKMQAEMAGEAATGQKVM